MDHLGFPSASQVVLDRQGVYELELQTLRMSNERQWCSGSSGQPGPLSPVLAIHPARPGFNPGTVASSFFFPFSFSHSPS